MNSITQKLLHGCHVHFVDKELKKYEDKMASSGIILPENSMTNSKLVPKSQIPIFWDDAM
jgi:hypothetical protein